MRAFELAVKPTAADLTLGRGSKNTQAVRTQVGNNAVLPCWPKRCFRAVVPVVLSVRIDAPPDWMSARRGACLGVEPTFFTRT